MYLLVSQKETNIWICATNIKKEYTNKKWSFFNVYPCISAKKGVGYGMEMNLYKSRISDGVLVQKRNRMSRCVKSHASVSQFFGTKRTHFRVPGLKAEALFSKLLSFFGVSADCRLVQICIYQFCII